jgi:hypothetical protein
MSRGTVVLAHLAAPLLAVAVGIVFAAVSPRSREGVHIQLRDTMYIVAHFHPTALLAGSVVVVTFVAYRFGALTWALGGAWAILCLHLLAAALLGAPLK